MRGAITEVYKNLKSNLRHGIKKKKKAGHMIQMNSLKL